jgi:hypothetical protein
MAALDGLGWVAFARKEKGEGQGGRKQTRKERWKRREKKEGDKRKQERALKQIRKVGK